VVVTKVALPESLSVRRTGGLSFAALAKQGSRLPDSDETWIPAAAGMTTLGTGGLTFPLWLKMFTGRQLPNVRLYRGRCGANVHAV